MDVANIVSFLKDAKERLERLEKLYYDQAQDELNQIRSQLKMVIRRIYPNSAEVEKKLLPREIYIAPSTPYVRQKSYLNEIRTTKDAIDVILRESELFGFEDLTPIKERRETEWKAGLGNILSFRKKKTT
jgi:seryl-tRNA(Sec) selenium transferase